MNARVAAFEAKHFGGVLLAYIALALVLIATLITKSLVLAPLVVLPLLYIGIYTRRWLAVTTGAVVGVLMAGIDFADGFVQIPYVGAVDIAVRVVVGVSITFAGSTIRWRNRELRRLLHEARVVADKDVLVDIANRRSLFAQMQALIAKQPESMAVLYADFDGFKPINDTYGHDFGDKVLIAAAERIKRQIRETDTLARVGGDEFVIVIPNIRREEANNTVRSIERAFERPFHINRQIVSIGVSVGISTYPADAQTPTRLVEMADGAMYEKKQSKKAVSGS